MAAESDRVMKAPKFWYQPDSPWINWLAPFEKLFYMLAKVRRLLALPYKAGIPVICVGNVVVGGSGKTPTALALAALLQQQGHKPVFVTRGYGGAQKGPLLVDPIHHNAEDVGDEALLLHRQAPVFIGRNRAKVIREAEKIATHIILDDGLQNPFIKPTLSLLVIDGAVGIGNGHVMPAGPLREPLEDALQRVAAVLVVGDSQKDWEASCTKLILRANLETNIPADFPRKEKFLAFAGIGRPDKFYAVCRTEGLDLVATKDFADHHPFRQSELDRLDRNARKLGAHLLTTEKDYVRLPEYFRARVMTFPVRLVFEDVAAIEKLISS